MLKSAIWPALRQVELLSSCRCQVFSRKAPNNVDPSFRSSCPPAVRTPVGMPEEEKQMCEDLKDYTLERYIGKGKSGRVYQFKHKKNKTRYAIKMVSKEFLNTPNLPGQLISARIKKQGDICDIGRGFILNIEETIEMPKDQPRSIEETIEMPKDQPRRVYLVSELFATDLGNYSWWWWRQGNQMPQNARQSIICQLIYGIRCLHQMDIIHGDIKVDNIFVNCANKLGEFQHTVSKAVSVERGDRLTFKDNDGNDVCDEFDPIIVKYGDIDDGGITAEEDRKSVEAATYMSQEMSDEYFAADDKAGTYEPAAPIPIATPGQLSATLEPNANPRVDGKEFTVKLPWDDTKMYNGVKLSIEVPVTGKTVTIVLGRPANGGATTIKLTVPADAVEQNTFALGAVAIISGPKPVYFRSFTKQDDIFALGIVFLHLYHAKSAEDWITLNYDRNSGKPQTKIKKALETSIEKARKKSKQAESFVDHIIKRMLCDKRADRITADELTLKYVDLWPDCAWIGLMEGRDSITWLKTN